MDEDMSPLTSTMEASSALTNVEFTIIPTEVELLTAEPIKLEEGEIEEPKTLPASLVVYSSSPPSLIEDASVVLDDGDGIDTEAEMALLRSELGLASYEYAVLEDRHCKLAGQHRELRKLCSAYNDVIRGYASNEELTTGIDQLRAEAGREGLRAKAHEADVLRPIIREAGGLQALVSQMQSVRSLIEKAGGLLKLEELVSDTHLLQISVDEAGGLQGLHNLISEVHLLRLQQQENAVLRDKVDGPDGLRAKAAKYDRLMRAIKEVDNAPVEVAHGRPTHTETRTVFVAHAMISPAEASRTASTLLRDDPDRDRFEAAPAANPYSRTGTNIIPLGPSRAPGRGFAGQTYERTTLKRKQTDEPPTNDTKRPRIDVGRASALVQASLAGTSSKAPRQDIMRYDWNKTRASMAGSARPAVNMQWQPRFDHVLVNRSPPIPNLVVETGQAVWSNSQVVARSRQSSTNSSTYTPRVPMVKVEDAQGTGADHHPMTALTINSGNLQHAVTVLVRRYPIALWTGGANPHASGLADHLKKADEIPDELGNFLSGALTKYISDSNVHLWNAMPHSRDICIVGYLVDGHRSSWQPQERRACASCSSASIGHHRPCALLQEVDGMPTVVFMPLHDVCRPGLNWLKKGYWMTNAN
ncbi:hypothetical protein EJ02DRAFT_434020 [Clathrospora elynae]|uniref:Uncharacterized protein n=1 Tax=Clathrospora elynae TaxID=706981 RepID=A0A6A5SRV4_9PLEO|nr:hypothetical protein EJ02DRAFT_434020 [Clathrospora elynae]